ncbi:MAG: MFS transporter, partial [Salinivirgaceae bacterium]|nr:MFS transporter [Salinivirgaceae bacterium]
SITGILMSQFFILSQLSSATASDRAAMSAADLSAMQSHELNAITGTYMTLGFVLLVIMVVMLLVRMPEGSDDSRDSVLDSFKRLIKNKKYVFGVIAQFFYVGAQICVWSFTIRIVMQELDLLEADAATIYLFSIIGFSSARFIFTWLMKWIQPSRLLLWAAAADIVLCLIVALCIGTGAVCIAALIGVSFFMSLMFPTIYGIALENVGADAKIGASGLIMAILGGALLPPLQGAISDATNINISYLVPMVCFVVVLMFAVAVEKGWGKPQSA